METHDTEVIPMDPVSFMPVEYNITEATIAEYKERFKDAECDTKEGYELVRVGLNELVKLRNRIEEKRLDYKREIKKFTDAKIDGVAKRITAELGEVEQDLKAKKKVIDDVKKEKERIQAEAEAVRTKNIADKMAKLECRATEIEMHTLKELTEALDKYKAMVVDEETYMEFEPQAQELLDNSIEKCKGLIEKRRAYDQQQDELRIQKEKADAEQKELDVQREKMRIEREAMEAEKRKQDEAAQAQRDELAEEQRKLDDQRAQTAREEQTRLDAIQKEKDDAALRLQIEAETKEKAEAEAKQKEIDVENERLADIEREKQRHLDMSDKEKLLVLQSAIAGFEIPALNNEHVYLSVKNERDDLCKFINAEAGLL